MQIGDKIKSTRKERRISLRDLSERTGVSHGNISSYEHNHRVPSLPILQKLATALELPLSYFVTEDPESDKYINDSVLRELFAKLQNLNEKSKRHLIAVINSYLVGEEVLKVNTAHK